MSRIGRIIWWDSNKVSPLGLGEAPWVGMEERQRFHSRYDCDPLMRFRPYAKMPAAGEAREQPSPGGSWVALEKIHGAQLVVAVRNEEVCFGKRKAWLAEEEPFFGWQLLRVQLSVGARSIASKVCEPGDAMYIYGELFGGHYPHLDVPAVPGLSPVQTGIWYAPDLRWSPFDILVARSEEDEGVLLAHHEVESLAREEGWMTPPVVRRGPRAEMSGVPTRMQTRVPPLLGLPAIEGNVAEGLVIKSDQRIPWAQRTAFKRKIEEFNESRFDESEAWDPQRRLTLGELALWAERLINPARIASAMSKWGRSDMRALLDEVILDVRVDLELAFPLAYRSLDTEQEEQLGERIRECAHPILETALATSWNQGGR